MKWINCQSIRHSSSVWLEHVFHSNIFLSVYFFSLTMLSLYGSYSVSKGAAIVPAPGDSPTPRSGYPYQKGHIGSLMGAWFPQRNINIPTKYTTLGPKFYTKLVSAITRRRMNENRWFRCESAFFCVDSESAIKTRFKALFKNWPSWIRCYRFL